MNDATKNDAGESQGGASAPDTRKRVEAGMFTESNYWAFMGGIFVVGGLVALPLTYGRMVELPYFAALPWSLASCLVFLIAFRKNGTISWGRAVPAMVALVVGGMAYSQSTGSPAFGAGGFLGFLLMFVCGYVGIGIASLLRIGKK
jgi:hypothetical protein